MPADSLSSHLPSVHSDAVWDTFLPSDYQDLISRSVNHSDDANSSTQKDLYLHLCDHPLIIDAGTKSFSLEKMSGKKCYMLAARGLSIAWGDTPQYWTWTSLPESRFRGVAELLHVCWLDIKGKISKRVLSPGTTYAAYMVYKSSGRMWGFENPPVQVGFGDESSQESGRDAYLDPEESEQQATEPRLMWWARGRGTRRQQVRRGEGEYPKTRPDGWLEVELGEYYVNDDDDDVDLKMYVMEVRDLNGKGGLLVQGIEIRPKVATSAVAA